MIVCVKKGEVVDLMDLRFVLSEFGMGVLIDDEGYIVINYYVFGDFCEYNYFVWV